MRSSLSRIAWSFGFLFCALSSSARASSYSVSPIRVDVNAQNRTALLTLRNESTEAIAVQASVSNWKQGQNEDVQLAPTKDVFFFPSMLRLAPGESKFIRVGLSLPEVEVERSYRIIVEQVPVDDSEAQGIRVLTRMSIPIFYAPAKATTKLNVATVKFEPEALSYDLKNSGNTRLFTRSIRVTATDAGGKTTFQRDANGWYLLAGVTKRITVPMTPGECRRSRNLKFEFVTDRGNFSNNVPVSDSDCP